MFDVLESVDFIQDFFEEDEDEIVDFSLMDQMKDLGYETQNVILNLGTLFVLMNVYFFKAFVLFVIVKPLHHFTGYGKGFLKKLRSQVLFNDFIYLFMEGFIEFLLSGAIATTI